MSEDSNLLRERLHERIRQLPPALLDHAERLLANLECGDLSPLLSTRQSCEKLLHLSTLQSGDKSPHSKDWPHAPLHRLSECGTYIVTAGTRHKALLFAGPQRLDYLESKLLELAKQHGWQLEAWAVFANYYHFVGHSTEQSSDLRDFVKQLHGAATAREINQQDGALGREVWHNFWDTLLTFEKSYLARLNYVHQNAVKHGLVPMANQYRWCSAAWFERTATSAQVKTIYGFKTDQIRIRDDFDCV